MMLACEQCNALLLGGMAVSGVMIGHSRRAKWISRILFVGILVALVVFNVKG